MSQATHLTHHQRTVQLWESIGREVAHGEPPASERRRCPRFLTEDVLSHLDVIRPTGRLSVEVVVQEVSAVGARLFSSAAVPVCQPVKLRPRAENLPRLGAVDARVAYCHRAAGGYRIGVEFYGSR
jgi:hypothetical protein